MTPDSQRDLEAKLDELNRSLIDGILADLKAPEALGLAGDGEADHEAMKNAQARARMARVAAEAALRRHNVTGIMQTDRHAALVASVAAKLDFSAMPKRPALPPASQRLSAKLSAAAAAEAPSTPDSADGLR